MKKYARLFVLTLAAVFVCAACDSSGGDDSSPPPPPPETVSYVSTSGIDTIELSLTYAAANNSPARSAGRSRAPAARSGTYSLKVNTVIASEGTFQAAEGDTLTFTSNKNNTFDAVVAVGEPLTVTGTITRDDGGEPLTVPPMTEKAAEVQVHNLAGEPLTGISSVDIYGWTLDADDDAAEPELYGKVAEIRNGNLTWVIEKPQTEQLSYDEEADAYIFWIDIFTDKDTFEGAKPVAIYPGLQDRPEEVSFMYYSKAASISGWADYEKGWNYQLQHAVGVDAEGEEEWEVRVIPYSDMENLQDLGYKWFYLDNPLEGVWERPPEKEDESTITFSGNNYSLSWEDDGGNVSISKGTFTNTAAEITFTQTSGDMQSSFIQKYIIAGGDIEFINGTLNTKRVRRVQ